MTSPPLMTVYLLRQAQHNSQLFFFFFASGHRFVITVAAQPGRTQHAIVLALPLS